MNTLRVLIRKRAADSIFSQSAGNAAAFLQEDTQFGLALKYSIGLGPEILLSIMSAFMLIKYEYIVSIGLLGSGFERLSAAAPAEQFHAFLSTKSCFFLIRKLMHFYL